jgi:hypothetical protein
MYVRGLPRRLNFYKFPFKVEALEYNLDGLCDSGGQFPGKTQKILKLEKTEKPSDPENLQNPRTWKVSKTLGPGKIEKSGAPT